MRRPLAAAAVASLLLLAGCASADPTGSPSETPQGLQGELTVFAAASLKASFDEIADDFENAHPDVDILPIVYDGSSTLVTQLSEGAPADVFASADENNMDKATDAGLAADPQLFASNTLVIVLPEGNPGGVQTLADLADPDLDVVLCADEVPCGAAAQTLLDNAGVEVAAASYEQNVTAVLTKVEGGADAGLVYVTDVQGRDDVESIVPDGAAEVVNRYPIVALAEARNPEAAQAFVDYVLGPDGQAVLEAHGFGAP
ncbi:MAG: molybdate ABC transporter substrate-binding protein [Microbacterium sp.]|uniref:molybdate ABC transporter substrate-binding protein n=1 Tax=Microbacterium sp. TaxID=51671 RepID=UPI0039E62359